MSRHFYPKVHFVENHQTVAESKIEMEFILCLLLRTLHFLNNFYDLIKHLYGSSLSALQYWSNNRKYLLKKAGDAQDEFPKIPQHLAILLGADEEISIADLVKLVKWSVDYSIAHISFYDFDGSLQNEENLFRMEFESLEPSIAENVEWTSYTDKQNDDMTTIEKFTNPESVKSDTCKNDDTLGFRLKIRILSCNEGKEKIVTLTKILAQFAGLNYIQERDITAELLNQKLTAHGRIPDPDVAIVFGNTLHHYGFLPWQSSITEFFLLPTHHDLSVNSFREILFKFSKCQQRYGNNYYWKNVESQLIIYVLIRIKTILNHAGDTKPVILKKIDSEIIQKNADFVRLDIYKRAVTAEKNQNLRSVFYKDGPANSEFTTRNVNLTMSYTVEPLTNETQLFQTIRIRRPTDGLSNGEKPTPRNLGDNHLKNREIAQLDKPT